MSKATFKVWRSSGENAGGYRDYTVETVPGMVVLDAIHQIQATARAGPGGALELQGGQVRLMLRGDQWQPEADVHDAPQQPADGRSRSPSSRCGRSR